MEEKRQKLFDAITLDAREFCQKYKVNQAYLVAYKHINKELIEKMIEGERSEQEPREPALDYEPPVERQEESEQVLFDEDGNRYLVSEIKGWYEMLIKNAAGEAEVHRLYKNSVKVRPMPTEETAWQAEPAQITPSRARPKKRNHKLYFAFGDQQISYREIVDHETQQPELVPIHDERAMRVARMICKDLQPDELINLGDTIDFSSLSRFKKDSLHFQNELGRSFQRVHDWYAELRADNPRAKIVEISSNHEVRLRDWVLQHMPQMHNVWRAGAEEQYPVMTYPFLANLGHVAVEWVGGYGAAEYQIGGNPDLIARHGRETSSNGTTASKIMKNHPETNNVHGHSHDITTAAKTLRDGTQLTSVSVGALCRTDGLVPGYHSAVDDLDRPVHRQQNWQQGVLVIHDYGEGHYQFDQVPIINGRAFYNGKEYYAD